MERRKFVLSVGTLAAGGSFALGTGAFSSVEAERDVSVTVAADASAYLGIQAVDGPNGEYVDTSDGDTLAINLTDSNDNVSGGGEGINTNAVTAIDDVFEIRNQGTREIDAAVTPLAFGDLEGTIFPPDVDGALAVLLVPQNPDEIDVDIEWGVVWPGIPVPEDVTFTAIRNLGTGDAIRFGLLAMAVPETAVGTVDVSDEFVITGESTQ